MLSCHSRLADIQMLQLRDSSRAGSFLQSSCQSANLPGKHQCALWLHCCGGEAPDHCSRALACDLTVCHVGVASDPPTVSCAPVHIIWLVVKDVFEGGRCSIHKGPIKLP